MSCVLQPQAQTKVNINFALPAGAAAERGASRGAAGRARKRHPPHPPRALAALPAGRRVSPLLHPSSALPAAGAPEPPLPPPRRAGPPAAPAAGPGGAGGGAEACGRVYCCRLAPSSVFLKAVTGRASSPPLVRKPQPRYHISEALVCAHNQSRHSPRLQKCYCTTKKGRTGFMLFGAGGKGCV